MTATRPHTPDEPGATGQAPRPAGTAAAWRVAGALREAAVAVGSVLVGFAVLELPLAGALPSLSPAHLAWNLAALGLLFAVAYLAGQRTRTAAMAFVGACLLAGVANGYVTLFKGQPIVPADLFALGTAAAVSGGYSFWPTGPMMLAAALAAGWGLVLAKLLGPRPTGKAPVRGERTARVLCNLGAAALVAVGAFGLYSQADIAVDAECEVDVWDVRGSYARQGTALCFLERMQEIAPEPPAGYSPAYAAELRAAGALIASGDPEGGSPAPDGAEGALPHVIAIMDETFSDLSAYPGLEGSNIETSLANSLMGRAAIGGSVVVSALGGGTCNSEFEFLTGASLGNLGGGVYPYVLYGFKDADSLPRAFGELGYRTRAIHPAEGSNWRRDAVYAQLGFDAFDDIATFKSQPGYDESLFRGLVSDRATYDLALAMLDEADGPQFVFDVTIQNHGGYDPALVPDEQRLALDRDAFRTTEMDEFASCMAASERDLAYLMDQLDQQPDPVVVCFFGDHQPGFANDLFERAYGTAVEGVPLEQVQERFRTPYLIWGNAAARSLGMADPATVAGGTTSLNYLGATLLEACGLPMGEHFGFLQALRQQVPAINMNGSLAPDGQWYWFDQDGGVADALQAYAIVQYGSLFGQRG